MDSSTKGKSVSESNEDDTTGTSENDKGGTNIPEVSTSEKDQGGTSYFWSRIQRVITEKATLLRNVVEDVISPTRMDRRRTEQWNLWFHLGEDNFRCLIASRHGALLEHIRHGIPCSLRSHVWSLLLGSDRLQLDHPGLFQLSSEEALLKLCIEHLNELLRMLVPDLWAARLKKEGLDCSGFTQKWFVTIFASFPLHFNLRIWDVGLLEGYEIVFYVAVAVLKHHEKELLLMRDGIRFTNTLPLLDKLFPMDGDVILPMAFSLQIMRLHTIPCSVSWFFWVPFTLSPPLTSFLQGER